MTKYTLEQVLEHTGIKYDFARKCLKHLRTALKPYEARGEFNRLLYNQSGLVIWDKIKQLKEQGLSIPEIKASLEATNIPTQTSYPKEDQAPAQTATKKDYLGQIIEIEHHHRQELKGERERVERAMRETREVEQNFRSLEVRYNALDSAIKMLPEGKTPEQIRQDWDREQRKKIEIASTIAELKNISLLRLRKRKALLKKLEDLTGIKPPADQEA